MESKTYMKNLKVTPRKLRLAADMVRKQDPATAVRTLEAQTTKSAFILRKAMMSAIANAKQTLKVSDDMLELRLLVIEEGVKLRRYQAGSRGMAQAFVRQSAHAKIVIGVKPGMEPKPAPAKKAEAKKESPKKEDKKEEGKKEKKVTKVTETK